MSDPGYRISDFFNSAKSATTSTDNFSAFMSHYWYVWLIIALIVVIMIAINVLMFFYFRRRKIPYKSLSMPIKEAVSTQTIMVPQKVPQPGQETYSQFCMDALICINKHRARHGVKALNYNENISKICQSWANTCSISKKLEHSPRHWRQFNNKPLGENLAYAYNSPLTGERMVDMWYRESLYHNYGDDRQPATENFCMMIWKGVQEVGFGRVVLASGDSYGVAMFSPPGNVAGQFSQNVFPLNI